MTQSFLTDISYYLLIFYTSLFLALIFVPLAGKIAVRIGVLDHPDHRKIHQNSLPRMGGVGIATAFLLAGIMCIKNPPVVKGILLGAVFSLFIGLIDDLKRIPPVLKFGGEILAAAVFLMISGVSLPGFGYILGFPIYFGPLAPFLTIFCMVGVINAMNLSDGLDGLAGGISAIALFFLAVLAYSNQAWYFLVLSLAGLGAILGFLRHNTHPAKQFMGDCGSLLLGFLVAALSVGLADGAGLYRPIPPIVMATILAVPIVDTLYVMSRRILKGKNPFHPDKTHLHHRLLALGLPHRHVVTIVYGISTLFGILGVLVGTSIPEWSLFLTSSLFAAGLYIGLPQLTKLQLIRIPKLIEYNAIPSKVIKFAGQGIPFLFPTFLLIFFFPAISILPSSRLVGYFAFAVCIAAILLYPWKGGPKEMPIAHGVFSMLIFCLLLLYMFTPHRPTWLPWYLFATDSIALIWSLPKALLTRRGLLALPSSYEAMLILFSWFLPMVLAPLLGIEGEQRITLMQCCAMALPILIFFKMSVRRHARRNRLVVLSFIFVLAVMGLTSLF